MAITGDSTEEIPPEIVFFGDSLSDNGNLFAVGEGLLSDEIRESFGNGEGRISNGAVFTEFLAGLLGLDSVANLAIAGAQAEGSYTIGQFAEDRGYDDDLLVPLDDPRLEFDINLSAQVERFAEQYEGIDLSDTLAVILIGGNDYSSLRLTTLEQTIADALQRLFEVTGSIITSAFEIAGTGVGHIALVALPQATFFPVGRGLDPIEQVLGNLMFGLHNAALAFGRDLLEASGVEAQIVDLTILSRALTDDPSIFGIYAPLTNTMVNGGSALLEQFDEDEIAFWDDIHPTTAFHGVMARFIAGALSEDLIAGTESANELSSLGADTLAMLLGGDDRYDGGAGVDTVFAGSGNDLLNGGANADLLAGGSGSDWVIGGFGSDLLDGGQGDDWVIGGAGADVILDSGGADVQLGGDGDDVFVFMDRDGAAAGDIVVGGAGQDALYLVLSIETIDLLGGDLAEIDPQTVLDALGITAIGIEQVVLLSEQGDLTVLEEQDWFDTADQWGLI